MVEQSHEHTNRHQQLAASVLILLSVEMNWPDEEKLELCCAWMALFQPTTLIFFGE